MEREDGDPYLGMSPPVHSFNAQVRENRMSLIYFRVRPEDNESHPVSEEEESPVEIRVLDAIRG